MSDLIDRNKTIEYLKASRDMTEPRSTAWIAYQCAINDVEKQPAVQPEQWVWSQNIIQSPPLARERHGRWKIRGFISDREWYAEFRCSNCGEPAEHESSFCPNCGAIMDEDGVTE